MHEDGAILAATLAYGREWATLFALEMRCRELGEEAKKSGKVPDARNMRAHPLYQAVLAKGKQQEVTGERLRELNELLLARFKTEAP